YSEREPADLRYANTTGTADNGGMAILNAISNTPIDAVGNGASAVFREGTALPAFPPQPAPPAVYPNLSYERVEDRVSGYVDVGDNVRDFHQISPATPHNSNPANCQGSLTVSVISPPAAEQGEQIRIQATVTPGTLPLSSNIQVTGDLSAIGGSASTVFADDGVSPDAQPNDNKFTAAVIVPQGNPLGAQSITLTATDQQGRRATRNSSVNVTLPALLYLPHEIQGAGATTPIALGEPVLVRGVVTALKANGFFLQTEGGLEDADPNTSEGLFVPATASQLTNVPVAHLVYVKGFVAELVPSSDPASPPITAVSGFSFLFDIGARPMPTAVELTSDDASAAGTLDQLERFEGMRVHVASLMAVNGTGADGAFYAVVNGQARPFREPG